VRNVTIWHQCVLCKERKKETAIIIFPWREIIGIAHQPTNNALNIQFSASKRQMHSNIRSINWKQPYLRQLCVCVCVFELCSAQQKFKDHQLSSYLQECSQWVRADHNHQCVCVKVAQSVRGQRSVWAESVSCFSSTHLKMHTLTKASPAVILMASGLENWIQRRWLREVADVRVNTK